MMTQVYFKGDGKMPDFFKPTSELSTAELKRRIKVLKPKGKYASRAVWGSINEYEYELSQRKNKIKTKR